MRVAITGASGLIGGALAARLEGAGHEVLRVRRGGEDDPSADWDPAGGWIRGGAFAGLDAIVNLSGREHRRRTLVRRAPRRAAQQPHRPHAHARRSPRLARRGRPARRARQPVRRRLLRRPRRRGAGRGRRARRGLPRRPGGGLGGGGRCAPRSSASARCGTARRSCSRSRGRRSRGCCCRSGSASAARSATGAGGCPWITLEDQLRSLEHALASELSGAVNASAPGATTNAELTKALGRALRRPTLFPIPGFAYRLRLRPGPRRAVRQPAGRAEGARRLGLRVQLPGDRRRPRGGARRLSGGRSGGARWACIASRRGRWCRSASTRRGSSSRTRATWR